MKNLVLLLMMKIRANLASGKLPRKGDDKISIKFLMVDVTGNEAVTDL